jgi:hypothetical protein
MGFLSASSAPSCQVSPKVSVGGSTSGSAAFTQIIFANGVSIITVYCSALVGTASYTFPFAMTNTPQITTTNGPAAAIVTAFSSTAITLTGATTTGVIQLTGI